MNSQREQSDVNSQREQSDVNSQREQSGVNQLSVKEMYANPGSVTCTFRQCGHDVNGQCGRTRSGKSALRSGRERRHLKVRGDGHNARRGCRRGDV